MPSNGAMDPAVERRLDDVESRLRHQEIAKAELGREIKHIHKTLDDLKTLMQTSVQLQERQVTQRESLGRAFNAINDCEKSIEDANGYTASVKDDVAGVQKELHRHVNFVKGAAWLTALGWVVMLGGAGVLVHILL